MNLRMEVKHFDAGGAIALLTLDVAAGWLMNGATISVPAWSSSDPSVVVSAASGGLSATLSTNSLTGSNVLISAGPATVTDSHGNVTTLARVMSSPLKVIVGGPAGYQILKQ
jgi:hypothetical protein